MFSFVQCVAVRRVKRRMITGEHRAVNPDLFSDHASKTLVFLRNSPESLFLDHASARLPHPDDTAAKTLGSGRLATIRSVVILTMAEPEGRRNRNQRRQDAAAGVFLNDRYNDEDQAAPDLERSLINRIFSPTAASATEEWNVPDLGVIVPPTSEEPFGHTDYAFQRLLPGDRRRRTWDWITKNVTFFYRDPDANSYYLRAKSSDGGVWPRLWALLFPNKRVNTLPRVFRTFELVNVTGQQQFNAEDHIEDTVYYEVDLASRAPQHSIPIEVYDEDTLEYLAPRVLAGVEALENVAVDVQAAEGPSLMAILTIILTQIVKSITSERVFNEPRARLVITYEVHSNNDEESILLSKGVDFNPNEEEDYLGNLQNLASRLLYLLWIIRESVMKDYYEENGTFVFHIRTIRVVLTDMPQMGGDLFTRPPQNLLMPRGGCMAVNGMPKALMELLHGLVVSHDIYRTGVFFDNNCGIREALHSLGFSLKNPNQVKAMFIAAANMRAQTPTIPPFIKLNPQQIFDIMTYHCGPVSVHVFELPTPENPMGRLWQHEPAEPDPDNWRPVLIVYSHEHYFGIRGEDPDERLEKFKKVCELRYCRRCNRYCTLGMPRVAHDMEIPSMFFPPCKARAKKRDTQRHKEPIVSMGDEEVEEVEESPREGLRTLRKKSKTPHFMMTPRQRIGFMDLETWRPDEMSGYHEVYAVGWIRDASWEIKTEDVFLYSSCDEPLLPNAALVYAFIDLIAHINAHPELFTKKKPYYLYLYNGSGFDNLFILHVLSSRFNMNPTNMALKDGRLMTMSYLDGCLVIRDLCLFTLCSLDAACKTHHVEDKLAKGHFDHNSITSLQVVENKWGEISEYLSKDLTALNMVFLNVQKACYKVFGLDICTHITMSHLSYDYWNTTLSVRERNSIILPRSFDEYQDFLKSFYGGRVFPQVKKWTSKDFHKLYNKIKDYLIDLDVVSLYVSVMWFSMAISALFFLFSQRNIPMYYTGEPEFVTDPLNDDLRKLELGLQYLIPTWPPRKDEPSMDYWRRVSVAPHFFDINTKGAIVCVDYEPNSFIMMPILPHKDAKGNTAWDLQPHEKQWYVLEEISDAVFYGYKVTKVHCAYVFPGRAALFDLAMKTLVEGKMRCKRGDPERDQYKLGGNSIYGKHAQKAVTEETKIIYPEQLEQTMREEYVLSMEPICDEQYVAELQAHRKNKPQWVNDDPDLADRFEDALEAQYEIPVKAFVVKTKPQVVLPSKPTQLGALVTAFARIHMNWFLDKMGLLFGRSIEEQVFYTDTDSLIVHANALKKCEGLVGTDLGMLDDELQGGKIVDYVGLAPKTYILVYCMPDDKLYMKIRAKGFPHTKETLEYDCEPIDPHVRPEERHWEDGVLKPENLDLKKRVYEVKQIDGTIKFYLHLNPNIFRAVLNRQVQSVTVHFTSMRRCFFGVHALGHMSGIKHTNMHRAMASAPWWDGDGETGPTHRVEIGDEGVTVPIGHTLLQ